METIETYIIRIYRRHKGKSGTLNGLVEVVGEEKTRPFGSREELWRILSGKGGSRTLRTARRVANKKICAQR